MNDKALCCDATGPADLPGASNRLLFVDDEMNVLAGYRRILHGKYEFDTAGSAEEALRLVARNGPYAVVIADMQMPGIDGMELLARMKVSHPDTVRMMVTGSADQKTAVEAVNKGEVYRFLNKPCKRELLIEALNNGLQHYKSTVAERERLARSVSDLDKLTERLSYETRHDLLTGLLNRHAFEHALRQSLEPAPDAAGGGHVLCHLDLDHFHVVNDTCSYLAGDALLRSVAALLSSHCRSDDTVARVAGDEFGLLFYDCSLGQARRIVEKIFRALQVLDFEWEGRPLEIRASAGLIAVHALETDATGLLSAAETACHVAMDQGGGQLHLAGPNDELLTERLNQAQWVTKIACALRENRFLLFAQTIAPIDDDTSGMHYEILLRMLDTEGRILAPGCFLGAAERFHLSTQIDRWVIDHTVSWLAENPHHLARLKLCSINLSGHSIGNPEMLELIKRTFDAGRVPPHKICFEITETAAVARLNDAVRFINELRAAGFRFALDDFGSGLSSFGYLKNLPVDYIKIDGQFVRQIDTDEVDRAMVRCINEVAKIMGKQTIAEYVDSARILAQLREIGVDFAQGYHVARPCPVQELLAARA
jgi:diguanylate cyclase (GGDEF)-like protein